MRIPDLFGLKTFKNEESSGIIDLEKAFFFKHKGV
jgi:hypothetical protein